MATYYIYSPFSNTVIASDCYCYRRTFDPCNTSSCPDPQAPNYTTYPYCMNKTTCTSCGSSCFCNNCCQHKLVGSGYSKPLDISAAQNSWIYAYMGANIESVKIVHTSGVCLTATGDITNGTYLEAYTGANATGKKLGSLLYGHLTNRQHSNNQIFNKVCCAYPWFVSIGQVPGVPANQTCYLSTHLHLNIKAETGVTASRTSSSCGATLSTGVSAIYWWVY